MTPRRLPAPDALLHPSDVGRRHDDAAAAAEPSSRADAGSTRLAALNPSLLQDLMRFQCEHPPGRGLDLLEVLAAALRHGRALAVHLQLDDRVISLVVQPAERRLQGPLSMPQWHALRLPGLHVLRVEPAPAAAPPDSCSSGPLGPLLWELALRGAREALLPEIAGVAAYRVTPGAELGLLDLAGSMASAVQRLRRQAVPLREIAAWPGFDRGRATRMLNGLYLVSALIVTRTHPGAISSGGA